MLVAAIELLDEVEFPEFPVEEPLPETEPELAFNFTELSMAVSNISAVCLLLCLVTADEDVDDDCCELLVLLELFCCLLFSDPVLEVELEEAFGPEFKPDVDDEEPFDLISLDIF